MPKVKREIYYLSIIFLIIFCIFQYGIRKICGFTMYPDEFGYWSTAAKAVGYDWSEVASLGSYYSFGYSLVLIPILKLFHGGVSAYRAAIAVNMFFMLVGMLLLQDIMRRVFPNISEFKKIFVSGIAVLYPPWIFYMQMTLAEALLMLLFIFISWLLVCFIQKPRVLTAVILAVTLIYIYSVHMRTIAVVIACLITITLWGISKPAIRKQFLLFLAVMLMAGIIVIFIKRNVILQVFSYADAETLSINDYGSQWSKIRQILSIQGMLELTVEVLAKLFYLGLASFGIVYWALGWSIHETVLLIKKIAAKKSCYIQDWVALFLLLSVAGEILISSIYMHGSAKIDCLIYGRYNEFLVPVFIIFGMAAMFRSRHLFSGVSLQGVLSGLLIPVLLVYIESKHMEGIRGYFVPGISSFMKEESFLPGRFLLRAWIGCFGIMVIVAVFITASKRIRGAAWMLSGIFVIEILMGIQINSHYTYSVNKAIFPDLLIAETIKGKADEEDAVVYLDEGIPEFIDFQQMQLPEMSIKVAGEGEVEKIGEKGRFLIVCRDSKYQEMFRERYDKQVISPSFILYYSEEKMPE